MIKKTALLLLLLFTIGAQGVHAKEESRVLEDLTEEFYEEYQIDDLEGYYASSGLDNMLGYSSIKDFVFGLIKGEIKWDMDALLNGIRNLFFKEISLSLHLMAQIIFLAMMAAILNNVSSSFGNKQITNVAFYCIYFVLIGLIANCFYSSVTLASTTIETMVTFVKAILPTLFLLLASVGAIASSTMLSPLVLYVVGFIGTAVTEVVYPLIMASAVVTLINHLSTEIKLSNFSKLLKDGALTILGFLFILFLGLVSIQGMALTTLDGISAKTAKYAIDNFVPFVGGFLADSMDTIISASNIIKNGVGLVGLLIIVGLIAFPIIKMFVLVVLFRLSAAIIQPISDDRIVKCLSDMGSYILMIMACVIVIAMMFFLTLGIIILLGDMTVMYR